MSPKCRFQHQDFAEIDAIMVLTSTFYRHRHRFDIVSTSFGHLCTDDHCTLLVAAVPWESVDLLLRRLEARRGTGQDKVDDDRGQDVVLLEGEPKPGDGDKWEYSVQAKEAANKELEEARYQPDLISK